MSVAELNGTEIRYLDEGEGPALVLLHSAVCDLTMWDEVAADLTRDHRVLRLDLRGFGQSPMPPGAFSWVDDLRALLDEVGVERPRRRRLLVRRPDRARLHARGARARRRARARLRRRPGAAAVARDGGVPRRGEPARGGGRAGGGRRSERAYVASSGRAAKTMPSRRSCGGASPRCSAATSSAKHADEAAGAEGPENEAGPPAAEHLIEVDAPTLVVIGTGDQPGMVETAHVLAAEIPHAQLVEFEGAAHFPSLEGPGASPSSCATSCACASVPSSRVKRIALLGATGSIGRQAREVIAAHAELELVAAASGSTDIEGLAPLTQVGGDPTELLERAQPDCVLNAITGFAGLSATMWALERGVDLALANKESLVAAGSSRWRPGTAGADGSCRWTASTRPRSSASQATARTASTRSC